MAKSFKNEIDEANSLVDFFVLSYKNKLGRDPGLNRYQAKFQMLDLLRDMGYDQLVQVIQYYFDLETNATRSFSDFLNSYHEVSSLKEETQKDALARARARALTMQKVKKYREELNEQRSQTN